MEISLSELEKAFNNIVKSVKENHGDDFSVNIEEDYYWEIDNDYLYKLDTKPKVDHVGSIYDDIAEIKNICNSEYYPVSANFKKLLSVLRYISDNVI